MDIAEVAQQAGLKPSTLRYYEQQGLIEYAARHGLRRQYHKSVLQRLALIKLAKAAGFSLQEIAKQLASVDEGLNKQWLSDKADELDQQIAHLSKMRDWLRGAAGCSAETHWQCETFQRWLAQAQQPQFSLSSGDKGATS